MTNRTLQKKLFQLSCSLIGIGVILGAFGAHGLKNIASPEDVLTFKTGVMYQFIHAFGILILALSLRRLDEKVIKQVSNLFLAGMVLFSGSLYALVLIKSAGMGGLGWIGIITPIGGLCFIAGWFLLVFKGYKLADGA